MTGSVRNDRVDAMNDTALVITVSTRAAAGVYDDRSGPMVASGAGGVGLRRSTARWWCRTGTRSATRLLAAVAERTARW